MLHRVYLKTTLLVELHAASLAQERFHSEVGEFVPIVAIHFLKPSVADFALVLAFGDLRTDTDCGALEVNEHALGTVDQTIVVVQEAADVVAVATLTTRAQHCPESVR